MTEKMADYLCDYPDAYILVTGDITVTTGNADTKVVFKNCHPFVKSEIRLNDERVEYTDNLDLIMNIYNLIEYSDNYSDSTASLYQFRTQEQKYDDDENIDNIIANDSSSFKYKSDLLGDATPEGANAVWKNVQIIVPRKYISSFFRSLKLPLINRKLYIQLNWTKNSVISSGVGVAHDDASTFKITKTELHVHVVTLKTVDNNKLNQLLDGEFKRTVNWNEYKSKIETNVTQAIQFVV